MFQALESAREIDMSRPLLPPPPLQRAERFVWDLQVEIQKNAATIRGVWPQVADTISDWAEGIITVREGVEDLKEIIRFFGPWFPQADLSVLYFLRAHVPQTEILSRVIRRAIMAHDVAASIRDKDNSHEWKRRGCLLNEDFAVDVAVALRLWPEIAAAEHLHIRLPILGFDVDRIAEMTGEDAALVAAHMHILGLRVSRPCALLPLPWAQ
jgi:hypothetical protein